MSPLTLLLIGSGPGIGLHVATHFAQHKLTRIILLSRNPERLRNDAAQLTNAVKSKALDIQTRSVDISDSGAFTQTLHELNDSFRIDCVFFNAARVGGSDFFDFGEGELNGDFEVRSHKLCLSLLYR